MPSLLSVARHQPRIWIPLTVGLFMLSVVIFLPHVLLSRSSENSTDSSSAVKFERRPREYRLIVDEMDEDLVSEYTFGAFPRSHIRNASLVGSSIAVRKERDRPLRVLFFANWKWFTESNARAFFFVYEYGLHHPDVEAILWGPQFPGWIEGLTLLDNIQNYFGSPLEKSLDLIFQEFLYSAELGYRTDWKEVTQFVPLARLYHECRVDVFACGAESVTQNVSLSFFACPYDMWRDRQLSIDRLFINVPVLQTLCPHFFNGDPYDDSGRDIDMLLTGVHMELYPFRIRMIRLIKEGRFPGTVAILDRGFGDDPDAQVRRYGESLRRAKIVLMDSSAFRYPLQKYGEAACAGALIIAEPPVEIWPELFYEYIVPIYQSFSDEKIIETVVWWLNHPKERLARAAIGQQVCRENFGAPKYIELLLDSYEKLWNHEYGLHFPYPWRIGCHHCATQGVYLAGDNQWCEGGGECISTGAVGWKGRN